MPSAPSGSFFELVLLADQSLVQAGWVAPSAVSPEERRKAVELLARGEQARGPAPLGRDGVELQWALEPGRGISTARTAGRVSLLSFLLDGRDPEADASLLDAWLASLRQTPAIQLLHGGDPEAFEIFRRLRDRPLAGSVLLPEGELAANKELVDFQRAVAAAVFAARWR